METGEFERLCHSIDDYIWVEQKKREITGGTITFKEIDKISEMQKIDKVMISGLKQDSFEYFIRTQSYKFQAIMFWKNKLVEDWSLLSTLKNVKFIGFFHNQRITQLWDMTENNSLEGLYISDFTRLHSLDGIKNAPKLERLYFGDAVWNTSVLNDLKALENSRLKEFHFAGKAIKEEDITIYTKMPNLERLNFRTNLYTTEQLAWLVANLPNVQGYSLNPYVKFNDVNSTEKDILICGKRKPFLSSEKDEMKIRKYVDEFEQMVEQFINEN
ncbi:MULTISPECIES: hypothetical protein [Bacillus]|uniref:hypothetical protein n=1 Tax=Bacillus TaxID=1386 RepID=UPI000BB96A81|nr:MULTISPECIES: hypothetical protein [Bacillus]